jgi:alkylhydroperoxidase family enzyme
MAYSTAVLRATYAQSAALWHQGVLDDRLKELVRIRSAQVNGCDVCAEATKEPGVSADDLACTVLPEAPGLGEREVLALDLVRRMAQDHESVDDVVLKALGEVFSPAEVVELTYCVAVLLGQHRFHHVFRAGEAGEPVVRFEPALVDEAEPLV